MTSLVSLSKLLSYVLRHHPEKMGVTLDEAGWVDVDTLLAAFARYGRPLSRTDLDTIVAGDASGKRRFEVHDRRIRAAQGHTVDVDLRLAPVQPPPVLYHGTVAASLSGIFTEGLTPRARRHVHLSADVETARAVGGRRGHPVILTVDAAGMHAAGHEFFRAANGVWLTGHVPPAFVALASPSHLP